MLACLHIFRCNLGHRRQLSGQDKAHAVSSAVCRWSGTLEIQAGAAGSPRRRKSKYLLIHLSSNDLGMIKCLMLYVDIYEDLLHTRLVLPNTNLIWTWILPRRNWHRERNLKNCPEKKHTRTLAGCETYRGTSWSSCPT